MVLAILLKAWGLAAQPADLIIENARIYTGNPKQPIAKSIAVRGSRIIAVGDNSADQAGPKTQRIDAKGATITAGFIDSHGHMAGLGNLFTTLNLRSESSLAHIAELVQSAAAKHPMGEWIIGRAWDQTNWGGKFPVAADIDKAAGEHPVYLTRVDGHAAWVNHKALGIAGVTKSTPDPPGGRIVRDERGEATGVLVDTAQSLVSSKIPPSTLEQVQSSLKLAAAECARLGITSVHDAGVGTLELAAYRNLISRGELPVRVYAMIGGSNSTWRDLIKSGPQIGEYLTVRSIKLYADGAMGSRGAAFLEPYADDPANRGLLIMTREQVAGVATEALAKGFQLNTHAIGDRANRTVLQAYADVLKGKNDHRFRIEHAQIVSLDDLELFRENSVIASIESTHATSDMRWAEARLGKARLNGAWMAKSFLKAGIRIANGSDFPVEEPNPMRGFHAAVTRQNESNEPEGGFLPKERLSREEALSSWTIDGAYAEFAEKDKGTLEAGKLADFVMWSQDIMTVPATEILKTRVRMTVVGGKIVYKAE